MSRITSLRSASSSFCCAISSFRSPSCVNRRACSSAIAACSAKLVQRHERVGDEGLSSADGLDEDVVDGAARRDRRHERLARTERFQREPPEDVVAGNAKTSRASPARATSDAISVERRSALDRDIARRRRRTKEPAADRTRIRARSASRSRLRGVRPIRARSRAARARRSAFRARGRVARAKPSRSRPGAFARPNAGLARVLLSPDAQVTDQDERRRQQEAIADGDRCPNGCPPELRSRSPRCVRHLRRDDQIRRQPALQCKAAERDRTVEKNCRNEQLRGH